MRQIGKINGENVMITGNEIGTHFYVDGKEIPVDVALQAFVDARNDESAKSITSVKNNIKNS